MTIIVGRGRTKATQRIDINDPTVSREHCWLTDNRDGTFILENKSPQGTYVDGVRIIKTLVTRDSSIKIGENTVLKVNDLIPTTIPSASNPVSEFSIRELESVWRRYHSSKMTLQKKQHSIGLLVRIPMIFSAVTGVLSGVLPEEYRMIPLILTLVGVCFMIYGFIQQKNFLFAEEMDKLDRRFQDNYVCPNPSCNHFMGNQPYHILRQDNKCRFCGCKLNEK